MKRILLLLITAVLAIVLLYVSRFWFLDLWPRDGLFGIAELRPGGGLLGRWVRGTQFAPFELLIWAVGGFLILSFVQRVLDFLSSSGQSEDDAQK